MMDGMQMNPVFQQIMQFGQQFKGDPKTEAMRLIKEGKFSQQQLDWFQNMAKQAEQVLGPFANIRR